MALNTEQQAKLNRERSNRVANLALLEKAKAVSPPTAASKAEVTKLEGWIAAEDRAIAELEALGAPAPSPAPVVTVPDAAARALALENAHKKAAEAFQLAAEALALAAPLVPIIEGLAQLAVVVNPIRTKLEAALRAYSESQLMTATAGYSPEAAQRLTEAWNAAFKPYLDTIAPDQKTAP